MDFYFTHGSQNSVDKDVVYIFKDVPTQIDCLNFCKEKKEDVNVVCVKNNFIVFSFKGLKDETNNALLSTINLHKQEFEFPNLNKMTRIVPLKVSSTILAILVTIRRKECRDIVVESLKSFDLNERIKTLQGIDFSKLTLSKDEIKLIAFRLGQTLKLVHGKEVYTKDDLENEYPELSKHLQRKDDSDIFILNKMRDTLMDEIKDVKILKTGSLSVFWSSKNHNFYHIQSRGIAIDIQKEQLIYFPLCAKNQELNCSWPSDEVFFDDFEKSYNIFTHESKILSVNEKEIIKIKKVKSKLNFDEHFHVFKSEKLKELIIKRNTLSLKIE
jgi:hypothetical protein